MSNTPNNNAWHGIPRDQINWHPTIVNIDEAALEAAQGIIVDHKEKLH
jgi:hypothetical protein